MVKECIDMIDGGDTDLHALWEACIRLFQEDPLSLTSGVRVDAKGSEPLDDGRKPRFNVVWSMASAIS